MPYRFSPSTLSLLKECPRCFWLHFNKNIRRPSTIFPSLPSGMDRVLKEHFDSFLDLGFLPPELKGVEGVQLFDDKELLKRWRDNRRGVRWVDDDGNVFMGALDNVLKKGDKLIVLDYKTRGYPLKEDTHTHYQDQMDIYNLLLRKNDFDTEEYSYLLFYHPEKVNKQGDVIFNRDLVKLHVSVDNAEAIFGRALKLLEGDMPDSSSECGFCKWADNH